MLVIFTAFGVGGWGQNFNPGASNDQDPTNFSNFGVVEYSGGVVCASCSATPVNETFRITVYDDGTNLAIAYFEWVVFGG